ncbi:MAG: hypothetical protein GC159_13500 [Phycisphaera sp.]|nr:hypothetical protein [Phycisphaera sp.]
MPTDHYILSDSLYRSVAVTDDAGAIEEAYDTDAYGNTLIFSAAGTGGNWWADDATQADEPTGDFIFTGRRYDPESEIYFYRARYYVPELGRLMSRDPIGYTSEANLFSYITGTPLTHVDPFGCAGKPAAGAGPLATDEENKVLCAIVLLQRNDKWRKFGDRLMEYVQAGRIGAGDLGFDTGTMGQVPLMDFVAGENRFLIDRAFLGTVGPSNPDSIATLGGVLAHEMSHNIQRDSLGLLLSAMIKAFTLNSAWESPPHALQRAVFDSIKADLAKMSVSDIRQLCNSPLIPSECPAGSSKE